MARAVQEGAEGVAGLDVVLKTVKETDMEDLTGADAIVIGSPTYFGGMSAEVKDLLDRSIRCYGKLIGKVGGAFSSSGSIGGGNETTILGILQALMIHGMVVQGVQKGDHYGPVSIREPDDAARAQCVAYGRMLGELTVKLFGP